MNWALARYMLTPLWPLVTVYFVGFLGLLDGDQGNSPAYYAVIAQVLPVLVLTLAVEGRAFRVRRPENPTQIQRAMHLQHILLSAGTLSLLFAGELAALEIVGTGEVTESSARIVNAAFTGGFAGIVVVAVRGAAEKG
jgi:hypothetical protein